MLRPCSCYHVKNTLLLKKNRDYLFAGRRLYLRAGGARGGCCGRDLAGGARGGGCGRDLAWGGGGGVGLLVPAWGFGTVTGRVSISNYV